MSWLINSFTLRRFIAICIVSSFILTICATQVGGMAGVILTAYFGLCSIGLILKCITDPRFRPGPYARAQKYKKSRSDYYISDFDETLAELEQFKQQCKPSDTQSRNLIDGLIRSTQDARGWNVRCKRQYAKHGALSAALKLLELTHFKTILDVDRIEEAAYRMRCKNDPDTLKKQGAPKGVIAKARANLQEVNRAERLLLNRPKGHKFKNL